MVYGMALSSGIRAVSGLGRGSIGKEMGIAAGGAAAGTATARSLTVVRSGEMALRLRRGIPRQDEDGNFLVAYPGIRATIPFTHGFEKVNIQDDFINIPPFNVDMSKDGEDTQLAINAIAQYHIAPDGRSLERAAFGVKSLTESVTSIVSSGIHRVIENRDISFLREREEVFLQTHEDCADELRWVCGAVLVGIRFAENSKTAAQMAYDGQKMLADAIRHAGGDVHSAVTVAAMTSPNCGSHLPGAPVAPPVN